MFVFTFFSVIYLSECVIVHLRSYLLLSVANITRVWDEPEVITESDLINVIISRHFRIVFFLTNRNSVYTHSLLVENCLMIDKVCILFIFDYQKVKSDNKPQGRKLYIRPCKPERTNQTRMYTCMFLGLYKSLLLLTNICF